MNAILRASFWTGMITLCRAISLFLIAKIIAVEVGPEGLGKIGQFISLMTILGILAGGSLANGLVRHIAAARGSVTVARRYFSTALGISILASLVLALLGFLFSSFLSMLTLGSNDKNFLIWILCFIQFAIALHNLFLGVINGNKDSKGLAVASLCGLFAGLLVTFFLTRRFGLTGALIGLMIMQGLPCFFSGLVVRYRKYLTGPLLLPKLEKPIVQDLSHYAWMAIATAIVSPVAQIFVRTLLQKDFSWNSVGYWQAAVRISDLFSMFMGLTLTNYYLPRLSESSALEQQRREVSHMLRNTIVFMTVGAGAVFLLRKFIIRVLFSEQFLPVEDLLGPQLLGDFFRFTAWVLAYLMLAKAMSKTFIATEILFNLFYAGTTWMLTAHLGLVGAFWAYSLTSFLYLCGMVVLFRKSFALGEIWSAPSR